MGKETKNKRTLMPRAPRGLVVESRKVVKEEYGEHAGEIYLKDIADALDDGRHYGEIPTMSGESVTWDLDINGLSYSDFDSDELFDALLYNIAYPVRDGHLDYIGLDIYLETTDFEYPEETINDLITLGLSEEDANEFLEKGYIEFWIDYDTNFDVDEWEELNAQGDVVPGTATVGASSEHEEMYGRYYGYIHIQHDSLGDFYVSASVDGKDIRTDGEPWDDFGELTDEQILWVNKHKNELRDVIVNQKYIMIEESTAQSSRYDELLEDVDKEFNKYSDILEEFDKKFIKESVETTRAQEVAHTIERVLLNDNIRADVYVASEDPDIVDVDIHWGDWKHDHRRAKHLIGLLFPDSEIETEVTEEDGGDTYSAIHHVYLDMSDDGEIASERKYYTMTEDVDLSADETAPEPGPDMGVANLLISLINDEWDAIKGYNDLIATISAEGGFEDMLATAQDIVAEENVHVGQLQKLLQQISPDALKIAEGESEAQEQLDGEVSQDKIEEPIKVD